MTLGKALALTTVLGGVTLLFASMQSPRRIRASQALAAEPIVESVPMPPKAKREPEVILDRPEIPEVSAPFLEDIALASIGSTGAVIYVNPKRCAELGPLVCGFFRQHEIGHVKLHHGGPRYTAYIGGREMAEDEADCYAAKNASLPEVKAAVEMFLKPEYVASALGEHNTGAKRAERIRACRGL